MWVADRVDEALEEYREAHGIARPWETRERVVVAITGAPGGDDVIRRAARMARAHARRALGVHVRSADGLRGPPGDALERAARGCSQELGGEYHELAGADAAGGAGAVRPGRERDADRARREPAVALDAPAPRLGDQQRASARRATIDVHVISSEPTSATTRTRAAATASTPRRGVAVCRRGAACSRGCWRSLAPPLLTLVAGATCATRSTLPSDLLIVPARRGRGRRARRLRARVRLRDHRASCSPTGTSRRRTTSSRSPRARTSSRSVIFLARRRGGEHARGHRVAPHGRSGTGAGRGRDAGRAERHARRRRRTRCPQLVGAAAGRVRRRRASPCSRERRRRRGRSLAAAGDAGADDAPTTPTSSSRSTATEVLVLRGDDLGRRRPRGAPGVRRPGGDRGAAARAARRRRARRGAGRGERAADRAARGGVARPAHAAVVDQGVGEQPAAARRRLHARGDAGAARDHRRGRRPAQPPRRQPARHEPAADRRAAARDARRRRSTRSCRPRSPGSSAGRAGRRRRRRDAAARAAPTPRCSNGPSPTSSRTRSRGRPPTQHVRVEACVAEQRVDLRVVDRGPGIPLDAARARCSSRSSGWATARNGSGVGLGLAVARGFVEAMGGEIAVEDTPGGGVTMVISLRRRRRMTRGAGRRRRAADPARARHQPARARLRRRPRARRRARARRSRRATTPTSSSSTSGSRASTAST